MKKTKKKPTNRPVETIVEKGQQIPIYHAPVISKGKPYDSRYSWAVRECGACNPVNLCRLGSYGAV
jgi:hypothetical protein